MRKSLALALLSSISLAFVPVFAAAPSFNQATKDYQAGKYQQALIEFEQFRASYPSNLMVHYYEALCYQGLNQLDKAKQEFQYVVENDEGSLKQRANAGLKQLDAAHITSTPGHSEIPGAPGTAGFNRTPVPGRVQFVLEFLDKDLCGKCREFATHLFQASCRERDVTFFRVIVDEGNDYRVPLYNPTKRHPYLVFLDGSTPNPEVLWKGTLPPDADKIIAQVRRYKQATYRKPQPVQQDPGIAGTSQKTPQIPNPPAQADPSLNQTNPFVPLNPY